MMRVKEEDEKAGLKLNIQKSKIISIQSHHFLAKRRGKVEAVTVFIFFGSKITADGDCSHEIKRHLFLGRKAMINLNSVLKSKKKQKHYLLTNVHIVKAMVFPVVLYGHESWTMKAAER